MIIICNLSIKKYDEFKLNNGNINPTIKKILNIL